VEVLVYEPGQQIMADIGDEQPVLRQEVTPAENSAGHLFSIGEPFRVDQRLSIAWRLHEEGQKDMFGGAVGTNTYRVDSILPNFSEDELRSAGQAYPTWIKNRYLALPGSVPERVLSLARDLTAVEPTPYDRAVALERYLRTFPYTLDVPTPPVNEEITDYFLFTLREGYCDYYATSMVVLARAAGLPARLVTGYALDQLDQEVKDFSISADQAHSWVEIYFPEIGWIPFEPTAGRPEIPRGEVREVFDLPELDLSLEFLTEEEPQTFLGWLKWPGLAALSLSLLYLAILLVKEIRFQRQEAVSLLPAIFSRLYSFGVAIGVQPKPGDSSSEYLAKLNQELIRQASRLRWKSLLLEIAKLLMQLDQIYKKYLFMRSFEIEREGSRVVELYSRLRMLLMIFWIMIKMTRIPVLKQLILERETRPETVFT
jgi:hypothetical protein